MKNGVSYCQRNAKEFQAGIGSARTVLIITNLKMQRKRNTLIINSI